MAIVVSPLTLGLAEKVRSLPVAKLIDAYRTQLQFDVSEFLPAIDQLEVYRCGDTGLEFFYPLNLEGPPAFYEKLYTAEAPEQDEKWEFDAALHFLQDAQSLLDIGCGRGAFLDKARSHGRRVAGLETSRLGREVARNRGLEVYDETIAAHASNNADGYDAVTAFQVLEHTADPATFIRASIDALRPGGLLVISVPNNDSFLKHCELLPLNMPPHHVALWNQQAIESLPRLFPIDLIAIEKQPLPEANLDWYQSTMEDHGLPKSKMLRTFYYRMGGQAIFRKYLARKRALIDGHTIMAIYRKRPT